MRGDLPLLTKGDYLDGLECHKRLFLKKYSPELAAEPGVGDRARMLDGQEIGLIARLQFPGGVLIDKFGPNAVIATTRAMEEAHTIFEAQIESAGKLVRVDVLQRDGEGWRVIEVKSSKEPKPKEKFKEKHLNDLAYQVLVLREAGVNVTSANLMLVSRSYETGRDGGLDPNRLFSIHEVTKHIEEVLVNTQFQTIAMLGVLAREEAPDIETNVGCKGCGFYDHCHVGQPEDDLVFLPRIQSQKVSKLRSQGIRTIGEIPDDEHLSSVQQRTRSTWVSGKPHVEPRLNEELEKLRYPLYLIDFETTQYAIPMLPLCSSYLQIPFQWSCHILESPDATPIHREFLFREAGDPRPAFARSLLECLEPAATVAIYSSFEKSIVRALDHQGVPHADELQKILTERVVDFRRVVEDHVYLREFHGSFSLKSVLPALAPDHNYDDLTIRDGEAAAAEYKRMIAVTTPVEEAERIARDLLAYCKRDTEAMVVLLNALRRLVSPRLVVCCVEEVIPDDTVHRQLALNI